MFCVKHKRELRKEAVLLSSPWFELLLVGRLGGLLVGEPVCPLAKCTTRVRKRNQGARDKEKNTDVIKIRSL